MSAEPQPTNLHGIQTQPSVQGAGGEQEVSRTASLGPECCWSEKQVFREWAVLAKVLNTDGQW